MATFEQTALSQATQAEYRDESLALSGKRFSDTRLKGNQRKGMVALEGRLRFVKVDALNLASRLHFEAYHDYQHSAVSEALTSCLVASFAPDHDFACVQYRFEHCVQNGQALSGTSSQNYIAPGCLELVLAGGDDLPYNHYAVSADEFARASADGRQNAAVLAQTCEWFERYGVEATAARHFILQQAGFDLLVGNIDRRQNLANIVFIVDTEDGVVPVNMDYNRCLQTRWSAQTERWYEGADAAARAEVVADYAQGVLQARGGLLARRPDVAENVAELLAAGFVPFRLDQAALSRRVADCLARIHRLAPALDGFAQTKAQVLEAVLADERVRPLWEVQ